MRGNGSDGWPGDTARHAVGTWLNWINLFLLCKLTPETATPARCGRCDCIVLLGGRHAAEENSDDHLTSIIDDLQAYRRSAWRSWLLNG